MLQGKYINLIFPVNPKFCNSVPRSIYLQIYPGQYPAPYPYPEKRKFNFYILNPLYY